MKISYATARETIDETKSGLKKDLPLFQQQRWKNALKQLADAANGLRSMIGTILLGKLEGKGDLRPRVGPHGKATVFASEMKFLQNEIGLAERKILVYFFAPTHTVDVDEIRNQNMLVHLYRVGQMAKKLRKAL